ncbi:MAG: FAD:protein FMN transferase [Polyangiaceae bacterium]|nr:FAD:protein FMN transferase [Polyangiaceae bacterium]
MPAPIMSWLSRVGCRWRLGFCALLLAGCERAPERTTPTASTEAPAAPAPFSAEKVDFQGSAMGTAVHFIAYSTPQSSPPVVRAAMSRALDEIRRLEALMTTWKDDSELSEVNRRAGEAVTVSTETLDVIDKSLWAAKLSEGTFDISFEPLSEVWKFGDASDPTPSVPSRAEVERLRKRVDYRRIEVDRSARTLRIGPGQRIGLGGIAKGYAVDAAAKVLRDARVTSFLVQAGGDLYGAGRKPDGSPWVSGVRDPRGGPEAFFATIELEDRAFSTAGDYARAFLKDGQRYHHILDPRTGFPARACRSVTIWAKDALTADAIDDGVFILGPEKGLALVESLDGVGAVIVDASNRVHVSKRLAGRVQILRQPTDGP